MKVYRYLCMFVCMFMYMSVCIRIHAENNVSRPSLSGRYQIDMGGHRQLMDPFLG